MGADIGVQRPSMRLREAKSLDHQSLRWAGVGWWPRRWRTVREQRSMSDIVKKANLGVMQHGVRACTLGQVAECWEPNGESGIP